MSEAKKPNLKKMTKRIEFRISKLERQKKKLATLYPKAKPALCDSEPGRALLAKVEALTKS